MAFPDINIGSKFDAKGFKQAQTATEKLNKNVKSLGRSLGVAFSVAAIVSYGKAATKAALDDSKAQAILANNLKNVGLAYDSIPAEQFINSMQKQTGILDDFLRPAYSQLAQVTGSVSKTQELLKLAFDASAGAGLDYSSTVDILSKAYIGNFASVSKLNLGLTKAEIAAMSFSELQDKIATNFAGAGEASLRGFSGQLALLNVELADTKETIGKSFINLLASFSGSKGIGGASESIAKLSGGISSTIDGISKLTSNVKIATPVLVAAGIAIMAAWSPWLLGIAAAVAIIGTIGNTVFKTPEIKTGYGQQSPGERNKAVAAAKIAADLAKKRAVSEKSVSNSSAAQLAAKKKQAALDKAITAAQLALNKGTDIFDLDKIQVNAALISQAEALGKATTGAQVLAIANDVQRLKVKQDISNLEDAIAAKDESAIKKATAKLNEDLKILGALQNQEAKLVDINKILAGMQSTDLISIANLNNALALLAKFTFPTLTIPSATAIAGTTYNPSQALDLNYDLKNPLAVFVTNMATTANAAIPGAGTIYNPNQNKDRNYDNFVININAGVIADPNAFVDIVQNALNEIARRGYSSTYAGAIAG
jgi:hypothetical protein